MSWLRRFVLRCYASLRPGLADRRLTREMDAHLALLEEEHRRRGLAPDDARRAARRAFGSVEPAREQQRDARAFRWVADVRHDLVYALRTLRRTPGFTLTALITLGAGIGFNVSLFTVFNVVALRAWDVRDPDRVVVPFTRPMGNRPFSRFVPLAEFEYLRDHNQTLSGLVAWQGGSGRLYDSGGAELAYVQLYGVSAQFFDVLGVGMVRGRGFRADEDRWGAPEPVAVISHGLWQRVFGGDQAVIGQTVRVGVGRQPVTIVGVTRRAFGGLDRGHQVDVFVPNALADLVDPPSRPTGATMDQLVSLAGRLKPESSRSQAGAELNILDRQFRQMAKLEGEGLVLAGTRPLSQPGRTDRVMSLFVTVGAGLLVVLLLACANVGNLQLARTIARRREIAVRLSLGAGRGRVVRQLMTEAVCLATMAALVGFGLSWILPRLLLGLAGEDDDGVAFVPDGTVFLFALGLAMTTALLFALAPALQISRPAHPLVLSVRRGIDRRGRRLRALLLSSQIALSLVLLSGAGLLTRGILHVQSADLGFEAHDTLVARMGIPDAVPRQERSALAVRVDAALRTSPLWPVGWAHQEPLSSLRFVTEVRRPDEDASWNRDAYERPLSPESFQVLGLEFVAGGPYDPRPEVRQAVINETLARMLFGSERAVGRTVLAELAVAGATFEPFTVTGVVRDSYYTTPAQIVPLFHVAPAVRGQSFLLFRSDRPDATNQMRALLQGVDSRLQVSVVPVVANIERALEDRRFGATLAWVLGAVGLTLATVGVFGVFAHAVEERRHELAVRVALGARARDVVRAIMAVHRWSVGGGVVVGLVLSVAGGFVLRSYLFGLSPLDPVAYLAVTGLLILAAALATAVPSRRAMRVDPAATLKSE